MEDKQKYLVDDQDLRGLLVEICRDPQYMFNDYIRGDDKFNNIDLIGVIVGMYEIIHIMTYGEPYDYFFHWANKCGSWVDTDYLVNILNERRDNR